VCYRRYIIDVILHNAKKFHWSRHQKHETITGRDITDRAVLCLAPSFVIAMEFDLKQ